MTHPTLVNVVVSLNDRVLSENVVEISKDGDLSAAVKAELDKVRCADRSLPLWGIHIRITEPEAKQRGGRSTEEQARMAGP